MASPEVFKSIRIAFESADFRTICFVIWLKSIIVSALSKRLLSIVTILCAVVSSGFTGGVTSK